MSQTHPLTTTTFELPGYRVVKSFGVVRGIIVRSRSIIGNVGASLQSLFGGNISLYTSLCERAREDVRSVGRGLMFLIRGRLPGRPRSGVSLSSIRFQLLKHPKIPTHARVWC